MRDLAQHRSPRMAAAFAALFALILQALYAVPAAERMALDEAFRGGIADVLCLSGFKSDSTEANQGLPGPDHGKGHCAFCVAASFAALAALAWLLVLQGWPSSICPAQPAPAFCPVRRSHAHRSRAPPRLI